MTSLGLAMLQSSVEAFADSKGMEILDISVKDNTLDIVFCDHTLRAIDDEQMCCETRYMACDDTLTNFIGAKLLDMVIEDAPRFDIGYDIHDVQFLHVKTSKGSFTVSNHNEHNGYYGGFSLSLSIVKPAGKGQ
jgi:hypothetical protein